MVKLDQLQRIMPQSGAKAVRYLNPLNTTMAEFQINTPQRMAAFLAQLAHESGQLRYVRELWGPTEAQKKYDGRRDLGNYIAGDGKRFMGRGLIQITGRANYAACGQALGVDLISHPDELEIPELACRSAGWFWSKRYLNDMADAGEWERISRRINGGTNGLAERLEFTQRALAILIEHEVAK